MLWMGEGGVRQFVMSIFWRFECVRIVDSTIHRGLYVKSAVTHVLGRALRLCLNGASTCT